MIGNGSRKFVHIEEVIMILLQTILEFDPLPGSSSSHLWVQGDSFGLCWASDFEIN